LVTNVLRLVSSDIAEKAPSLTAERGDVIKAATV
jgi:hypothetical protein